MSPGLVGGLGVVALAALLCATVGRRHRIVTPLAVALGGAALAAGMALSQRAPGRPALLVQFGLGNVVVSRIALGVVAAGGLAMLLELASGRERVLSAGGAALGLLLAGGAALALTLDSAVPIALLLGGMTVAVWVRWERLAGPMLAQRNLGRQAVLVLCALIGAAAVLPSEQAGGSPPALAAMLVVGGLAGAAGVLPFSIWSGALGRVSPAEGAAWRVWLIPVAVLVAARVLAAAPPGLALALGILLVSLGLATAMFWSLAALTTDPAKRYWAVLSADVGLMFVGVGSGNARGLAGALLLLVVHWLAGSVLTEPGGSRSHLLSWVGLAGMPPFGGFAGRLLVLLGIAYLGPLVFSFALLALGLLLVAGVAGLRDTLARTPSRGWLGSGAVATLIGTAVLAVGLAPGPILAGVFGVHP